MYKIEGFASLFRGVTAVFHGYTYSSSNDESNDYGNLTRLFNKIQKPIVLLPHYFIMYIHISIYNLEIVVKSKIIQAEKNQSRMLQQYDQTLLPATFIFFM